MRSVVAIVNHEGNVLIGKKIINPTHFLSGKWHVPGGHLKKGESDEKALAREMLEETGIVIDVKRYIASHKTPTSRREARWYECFYVDGILKAGDDLQDAKWIPKSRVLGECSNQATELWPEEIKSYFSYHPNL